LNTDDIGGAVDERRGHTHHEGNRMKFFGVWMLVAGILGAGLAHAAPADEIDDRVYITPMFSYVLADDARDSDDGLGATLAIGKPVSPHLEIELRGSYLQYDANDNRPRLLGQPIGPEPEDYEVTAGGIGASYFFESPGRGFFLHGDAMVGDGTLYNAGIGFDWGGEVRLRFEALYHWDRDDVDFEEPQFNLGLRIPIGKRKQAPPPPPVQVVPPVEPSPPPAAQCGDGVDNDADGAVDFPADPGCTSEDDEDEADPPCELPPPGQTMSLAGCKTGDTIVLRGVNFEFDKANLTVNAKSLLDMVVDALNKRPDILVEIDGHTDSKGSDTYNQKLSERRAQSVMRYLVEHGIAADRLSAAGFGESMPVADNATDEGRELNRRVELKVLQTSFAPQEVAPGIDESEAPSAPAPAAESEMTSVDAAQAEDVSMGSAAVESLAAEPEPAAGAEPPPQVAGSTAGISIGFMVFEPASLTIAPGTTVTWVNHDGSNHIVKFADQQSPRLRHEASYSRSFDVPGEYPYECAIHGKRMSGTIIVR
jgi:outer membrane protein OmpA-like peptidoglycan-associated protein/plastocyanin